MPVFAYTALSASGREERGTVSAESPAEARRKLRAASVHVIELSAEAAVGPRRRRAPAGRRRRVSPRAMATATRQLSTLLHAGMPLVPALSALEEQCLGEPVGRLVGAVRDRVNEGSSLAAALEEHPHAFSELYVSMVRAGEAAGTLEDVLIRLARISERRVALLNRVRAALAYPAFMALVGTCVVVFLLTYVIPSITRLFLEMNRRLPWPTVLLMRVSSFIEGHLPLLLVVVVGLVAAGRLYVRTSAGRAAWDRLKLRLPLTGGLALKGAVANFARTFGSLLASGVPVLDALDIAARVVGNTVLSRALQQAKESVRRGQSMAEALRGSGAFPPIVLHMIAAGEAGGKVEEGLLNVADAYDAEVEAEVTALTSLLEPVLIVVLGAVVGFIVVAILLPIFDINQAIR